MAVITSASARNLKRMSRLRAPRAFSSALPKDMRRVAADYDERLTQKLLR
jgi:hypothetical protein